MIKTHAVIGMGFGDEGKGRVVDDLCSHLKNPCVIRFSGGQQAAHNVVHKNGLQHVFANFGSGTLRGIPTMMLKYCTIDPVGILKELKILKSKGIKPKLFISKKCPVTTTYDKIADVTHQNLVEHSSCGVGVGRTKQREEDLYSLVFGDLFHPTILRIKLQMIEEYYCRYITNTGHIKNTIKVCNELINSKEVQISENNKLGKTTFHNAVLEGSQGLLLDQNIGFFPYVTRSNTDLTNINKPIDNLYLVTRAYQTRHGNGHMTNEHIPHNIKKNPYEENQTNVNQGKFRISILDLDLLKYSVSKVIPSKLIKKVILVITCLDLVENEWRFTLDEKVIVCKTEKVFISRIAYALNMHNIGLSRSPIDSIVYRDNISYIH